MVEAGKRIKELVGGLPHKRGVESLSLGDNKFDYLVSTDIGGDGGIVGRLVDGGRRYELQYHDREASE